MEYLGNCPNCGHHTIVETIKRVTHGATRNPQREAKCVHCGQLKRITLIGDIIRPDNKSTVNSEFATYDKLTIKFWE